MAVPGIIKESACKHASFANCKLSRHFAVNIWTGLNVIALHRLSAGMACASCNIVSLSDSEPPSYFNASNMLRDLNKSEQLLSALKYLGLYSRVELYEYQRKYDKSYFDVNGQEWRPGIVRFGLGDRQVTHVYYDTYPEPIAAESSCCSGSVCQ